MATKKKYKQVKINLSEEDHAAVSRLAADHNMTIAEFFRQSVGASIDAAPAPKGSPKHNTSTDPALLYEFNRIGNNLNQITRHINTDKTIDRMVLPEIIAIRQALQSLTQPVEDNTP